ncbi:trimethyllysine dioxygenase, mitochondrial, partial [Biomphalaria glabrata]
STMTKWIRSAQILNKSYTCQHIQSKFLTLGGSVSQHFYYTLSYKSADPRLLTRSRLHTYLTVRFKWWSINSGTFLRGSDTIGPYISLWSSPSAGHNLIKACPSRHSHTQQQSQFSVVCNDECVQVSFADHTLKIPLIWLRDHCRSEKFYNHNTHQKIPQSGLSELDLSPAEICLVDNNSAVSITWKDGHVSKFNLDWLANNFYPGKLVSQSKRQYWNNEIVLEEGLQTVSYNDHMTYDDGLKKSLTNLVKFGFCIIEETPVSQSATQAVAERISYVLQTVFGQMWTFTSDASRSDTAYTTQYLGAHTDNTYLSSPAGVQVFHCLKHNGSGGETLLVDGFKALDILRSVDQAAFKVLASVVIPHEYKEQASGNHPGYHLYNLSPVVTLHPISGEYISLRFNPYDRAPLNTLSLHDMTTFYSAYDKLSKIISNKENELRIKLNPGTVLLIDNWRVLHGRSSFDGTRVVCGCYLPRDEWISKARLMGLL